MSPLRIVRPLPILTLLLGVAFGIPRAVKAQQDTVPTLDEIERRVEIMEPVSGPPGTTVRLSSAEMPSITPIRVGLGAVRAGFESLLEVLTSMDGAFDVTVEVPDWAQWDRVHRFVVFDIYFRPIALSELFHVTDAEGLIHREGTVMEMPDGCRWLRDIDGIEYGLSGHDPDAPAGGTVSVDARVSDSGSCGRPFTLDVVKSEVH